MAAPSRSSILRGAASLTFGAQVIYTVGDIKVDVMSETTPIKTSAYGTVGQRLKDILVKLTFTPAGEWTTALLAVLYPYTNPVSGTSIFTGSDVPLTLHPLNGKEKIVFTAAAITKMPGLILSATKTAYKDMEITCLLKNNADRSATDALYTLTATDAYTDTSFAIADVPTCAYTCTLAAASSPWDAFIGEVGVEVDFNQKNQPTTIDGYGTVDMSLEELDVIGRLKPVGLTVDQVLTQLKIQGTGVRIGMDLSAGAANLTITGGSTFPQVVLNSARLVRAGQIYGPTALRHDNIEFRVTRPTGSGAMFTVGVAS